MTNPRLKQTANRQQTNLATLYVYESHPVYIQHMIAYVLSLLQYSKDSLLLMIDHMYILDPLQQELKRFSLSPEWLARIQYIPVDVSSVTSAPHLSDQAYHATNRIIASLPDKALQSITLALAENKPVHVWQQLRSDTVQSWIPLSSVTAQPSTTTLYANNRTNEQIGTPPLFPADVHMNKAQAGQLEQDSSLFSDQAASHSSASGSTLHPQAHSTELDVSAIYHSSLVHYVYTCDGTQLSAASLLRLMQQVSVRDDQNMNDLSHSQALASLFTSNADTTLPVADLSSLLANSVSHSALQETTMQKDLPTTPRLYKELDFLSIISHELRTPMNGILGMSQLLLDLDGIDEQQLAYVRIIDKSTRTLLLMLNDILDYAKMDAGKMEMVYEPLHVGAMMGEVLDMMLVRASEKELQVSLSIHPQVPELILSDSKRLRQVLLNLLGNAIKFTLQGHIHIAVTPHSVSSDGGSLQFSVTDSGIGIPQEQIEYLFQPFHQLHNPITRNEDGTGLGLAISKCLVELMGGTIWIEPQPQPPGGTRFAFTVRWLALDPTCDGDDTHRTDRSDTALRFIN